MSQDARFTSAAAIEWTDLVQYLTSRGFQQGRSRRDDVGIFRRDDCEIVVPLDRSLADYAEAIATAAERIAAAEKRSVDSVLADLVHPRADQVRVGRTDAGSEGGTLALQDGAALLAGARRALLAAACSVERPEARFHKRMSFKNAESFVNGCRLGQTERGSFILTIMCPLEPQAGEEPVAPFGRRAVERLFDSIGHAVLLMRQGRLGSILDEEEPTVITSNLCEALVEMMPADQRGDLWLAATWSPLCKASGIRSRVQIDRDLFPLFEDLGQRLRPPGAPRRDHFVGRVIELSGEDNHEGRLEGEIVLLMQAGEELIRARCALDADAYALAVEAHRGQRFLSLHGLLRRRPKTNVIEEPEQVKLVI